MIRLPPTSTRTYTRFPYTTLCLSDDFALAQDRDVLEHRLAAIAEARRLDRGDLQTATQLVDDERGQLLALDVLGDDQQRTTRSEEHTSELQSLMRISYAAFCLKKKTSTNR